MNAMKWDDLMEFQGEIVDMLEDYLDEKGIDVPNEERERDRELDPENAAKIYGGDYDTIANPIEGAFMEKGMECDTEYKGNFAFTKGEVSTITFNVIQGLKEVLQKSPNASAFLDSREEQATLQEKVAKFFSGWNLLRPERDRTFWREFAKSLSYQESRDLRYVLERPNLVEDIQWCLENSEDASWSKWMREYLAHHKTEECDLLYDKIISEYNDSCDCEIPYWDNLRCAIENTIEIEQQRDTSGKNNEPDQER